MFVPSSVNESLPISDKPEEPSLPPTPSELAQPASSLGLLALPHGQAVPLPSPKQNEAGSWSRRSKEPCKYGSVVKTSRRRLCPGMTLAFVNWVKSWVTGTSGWVKLHFWLPAESKP